MTTTVDTHTGEKKIVSSRAGAIGGLVAAAAFIFGIALLVTSLSDYTDGDATPAESVEFLVGNQSTLFVWYLVIYLVFGVAIIPLARSLRERLVDVSTELADIGAVFAYIWAGLMFATGMIENIGIAAVADLNETDPAAAEALWSSISTVADGLGGGNELVGGMWILLVSLAAWGTGRLPRGLNVLGVVSAASGLITLVPGLTDVGIIFGLGSIAWFAWAGIVLLRNEKTVEVAR
ncbi:MAG: DUF4386 family protein [Acidimicrobiia bacterium]|nr:DUF4386 family protein [Acidimicrobiia bacterium]